MLSLFSVDTIAFTIFSYPMSYIELLGTLCNLACVWLVTRRNIANWPIGLIGVLLFGILFWQIQLYADVFEQVYYAITGVWGWLLWSRVKTEGDPTNKVPVETLPIQSRIHWGVGIVTVSIGFGFFLAHIHTILPALFSEPASMPYLDSLTTVMSFAAQLLLMRRVVESWILWVMVDCIAIWLYATKGIMLVSVLYAVFLVLATKGLIDWRAYSQRTSPKHASPQL